MVLPRVAAAAFATLACGCDEPARAGRPGAAGPGGGGAGAAPASTREPVFAARASKPTYDRAVDGMRALDALRGSVMNEALASDLGFKCADLVSLAGKLASERDPIVWRLRTDIDKTCKFDVPVACARLEVQIIERKHASDPNAPLDRECAALKLAIGDTGSGYLQNPTVLAVGDKYLTYCEVTEGVRRIP
jgi:hypothetical protein